MTDPAPVALLATADVEAHRHFVDLVAEVRPELFRYCARMTGSLFDGEDVVQDTLAKAYASLTDLSALPPLRPWLFRIAHNAALDFLKRYERRHVDLVAEVPDALVEEADEADVDSAFVEAALARCVALPPVQRSALVLKDVLGHSLAETAACLDTTVPAVKAALVRARANLARGATQVVPAPPRPASTEELRNLRVYAELFNRRDWAALRALMTEQSRLDVVTRTQRRGAAAAEYYGRYSEVADREGLWVEPGYYDDKLVLAFFRTGAGSAPAYFALIEWKDDRVALIRDFRYVPYLARNGCYAVANAPTKP